MPIIQAGLARQTTEPTVLCNYEIPAGVSSLSFRIEASADIDIDHGGALHLRNDDRPTPLARSLGVHTRALAEWL